MLWIIIFTLFLLWIFGIMSDIFGDLIHILIMMIILAVIFKFFQREQDK